MPPSVELEITRIADGFRVCLRGPWRREFATQLRGTVVRELELNMAKGWRGDDVDFLAEFPDVRAFDILDLRIKNIDGVHQLRNLEALGVQTYCRTPLRFECFPRLTACGLDWGQRDADSILGCTSLRSLNVGRIPRKDLADFTSLVNLDSLAIGSSPIESLRGIDALVQLKSLCLGALRKLADLSGLEGLGRLDWLEIQSCRKVRSLERVSALEHLRTLHLNDCGEIESLRPIANLRDLEVLLFYGTTRVADGDLSMLRELPRLRKVAFMNRRHYSLRCESLHAFTHPREA